MLKDLHTDIFNLDSQYVKESYSMRQTQCFLSAQNQQYVLAPESFFSVSPALPYAPWLVQKRSRFFVGGVAQTRQAKVRWQKGMKTASYMSICTTAKNKASPQSLLKLHLWIKLCAQMCAMFRCVIYKCSP